MTQRIIIAMLLAATITSCSGLKRMQKRSAMKITPSPMELAEKNGRVDVNYMLETPKRFVKRGSQVIFEPRFIKDEKSTNDANDLILTNIVINGKKFERQEKKAVRKGKFIPNEGIIKVIATKKPMTINVSDNVPFETWMQNSNLYGYTIYNNGKKKTYLFKQLMSEGVAYNPPAPPAPQVIQNVIEVKEEGEAVVYFKINSYVVDNSLDNNSSNLKALSDMITSIQTVQGSTINKIVITGIASPDGTFAFNEKLSQNRTEAAKKYLMDKFNIPSQFVTVNHVSEDWEGLGELIAASNYSDKSTLLNIISSNKSDAQKNAGLRKSPNFKDMAANILPKLRRAVYEVYFTRTAVEEMVIIPQ